MAATGFVRPLAVLGMLGLGTGGCDSRGERGGGAIAEIASSKPSLMGQPDAAPAVQPAGSSAPVKPAAPRPSNPADLLLTPQRRAALEREFPEAVGFRDISELETELYELELIRGKESSAVSAFDQRAREKWVLFTGNVVEPTEGSLKMPVRYTPRDATDPLGMTSSWFAVELTDIEGYDAAEYKQGDMAAMLVRYKGSKRASPGYDVILLRRWFIGERKRPIE